MRGIWELSAAALVLGLAGGVPVAAFAADAQRGAAQADGPTREEMVSQLAEMRAQMAAMARRIDQLQAEVAGHAGAAGATPVAATAPASAPVAAPAPVTASAKAETPVVIEWKGAPKFETSDGWSFKVGGRINLDTGYSSSPAVGAPDEGFGSEMRRLRLRVEGTVPGGFGYKVETDIASSSAEITDAYLNYTDHGLTITAGQQNNFQGLEELSSSLNTSFIERAAFTDAFAFERRVGLSAAYHKGALLVQGGVFTDNAEDLPGKNYSLDTRLVFMPRIGKTQLHFGGSFHYTDLNGEDDTLRYRQRPFEHFTSTRYLDTGTFSASAERGIGLESAVIAGPFHASAEGYWQKVVRPGLADPTFFGGSFELGYFLTKGDHRGYKNGVFDRVKPAHPVGEGGIGAIQVNLRYDYLDLTDAGIVGGTQKGYEASLIWTQTDYTRLMFNYGHLDYTDAAYATASGSRAYGVDVFAVRAQLDF